LNLVHIVLLFVFPENFEKKKGLPEVPTSLIISSKQYYMNSPLNFRLRNLSCATTMYLLFLLPFLFC